MRTAEPANPRRFLLASIGVLFVLTGAAALIAEEVFERLLSTLLGTSTPAAAITLAVYFAGLTLGAWSYRAVRRSAHPIRFFGVVELGVGLWSLLLYAGFERLIDAFTPLLRLGAGHFATLQLLRTFAAVCWIVPPTLMMGMSFPAIVDALALIDGGVAPARVISRYYSLNLLGAMAGALAAPFAIFPYAGLDGALLVIAGIEACVFMIAGFLSRSITGSASQVPSRMEAGTVRSGIGWLLFVAALGSGFLFFGMEVLWTHLIAVVCGSSIYAFVTMLASVLGGLFLGGMAVSLLMPRGQRVPASILGFVLLAGSAVLAASQQLWPQIPHLFPLLGRNITSFGEGELLRGALAALLLVPPAAFLGGVFPLMFRLREFPDAGQGETAGKMVAANAVGCLLGALVYGFLLIPALGSEATFILTILVYALLGVAMTITSPPGRSRSAALACGVLTLLAASMLPAWDRLALTGGQNVYFVAGIVQPNSQLLMFHEDTAGGITTVIATPGRGLDLLTNGKFQGNDTGERPAQVAFALIPSLHLRHLENALVIGLGTGQSADTVAQLGFSHVDVAEIAPGVIAAARDHFRHINHGVLDRPNVMTHLEDGRNFLLMTDQRYDLISIELTSVWFAGATNLYSREFYANAEKHLQPGGVFQQWIQLHHMSTADLISMLATVRSVFPQVSFWVTGSQGIVVAGREPQVLRAAGIDAAERVIHGNPVVPRGLRGILDSRVLAPPDVDRIVSRAAAPLNTDRNRRVEYWTPRQNLSRVDWMRVSLDSMFRWRRPAPFLIEPGVRSKPGF